MEPVPLTGKRTIGKNQKDNALGLAMTTARPFFVKNVIKL